MSEQDEQKGDEIVTIEEGGEIQQAVENSQQVEGAKKPKLTSLKKPELEAIVSGVLYAVAEGTGKLASSISPSELPELVRAIAQPATPDGDQQAAAQEQSGAVIALAEERAVALLKNLHASAGEYITELPEETKHAILAFVHGERARAREEGRAEVLGKVKRLAARGQSAADVVAALGAK